MPEYLEQGPSGWEKAMFWGLGLLMLAFFASVPSMYKNKQENDAKLWQDQGCQMYDDFKPDNIPAKCSAYFIDHYKAQQARPQPPEAK